MVDVRLDNSKTLNHKVSHLDGVIGSVEFYADTVRSRAESVLSAHREEGKHSIGMYEEDTDRIVTLDGPAAMSVEVGHHHHKSGEWVEGINTLRSS